jgi:hypothetical protein
MRIGIWAAAAVLGVSVGAASAQTATPVPMQAEMKTELMMQRIPRATHRRRPSDEL